MILLWLACRAAPDPSVAQALAPWPETPEALAPVCATQAVPELATTCHVQLAALWATRGEEAAAAAACAAVPAGTWAEECAFRVGEELAVAGRAPAAAAWCGRAGWFARRCVTHAAWRLRPDPDRLPPAVEVDLAADLAELLQTVETGLLVHADPGVAGEGRDAFRAAWGRAVYWGRGRADPGPTRGGGEAGPALRSGWASEAARLLPRPLPVDPVATLLEAWTAGRVLEGAPDPDPPPPRYAPMELGPQDQGLPHLPLFGGGMRLVGDTVEEDALLAILEGLYGRADVGADLYLPWIADPRPRVRWTAARLGRLAGGPAAGPLAEALARSEDPVLRGLAARRPPAPR